MATGTVYTITLPVTNGGWANFTARETWLISSLIVPPGTPTTARVQFTAGTGGWDINEAFIGNLAAAGGADFTATPTRLTFSNGNSTSLGSGASRFSDWVPFAFNRVGAGLVITSYTAAATNDNQGQNNRPAGQDNLFKAGNDASTVVATGYSSGLGTVGISAIEMDGFELIGGLRSIGSVHIVQRVTATGY